MIESVPRLRMFAGPNGSGKTTVKNGLNRSAEFYGIYLNADDLESTIRNTDSLPLEPFGLAFDSEEIQTHFSASPFLKSVGLDSSELNIKIHEQAIEFDGKRINSYYASVLSDFLRRKALESSRSFSFETVMSARDKVDLLREAQRRDFRTYLYFVATDDPTINVARVRIRVARGGHGVPEEKIIARYHRSLALLREAIRFSNRAFLFDSSTQETLHFAEVTDGTTLRLYVDKLPQWFQPIWDRF